MMMNTMTMTMPTHMEILAMARELLLERYLEEKAKILYRWTAMNDWYWQTEGKISDYPDMPEYPTMEEIMALARHLQEYFTEMAGTEAQTSMDEMPVAETWNIFEPAPEPTPGPTPAPMPEPTPEPTPQPAPVYVMNPVTGNMEIVNASAEQPAQSA